MTVEEFTRTNPWFVSRCELIVLQDDSEPDPEFGLVFHCTSRTRPQLAVTFTFRVAPEVIHEAALVMSRSTD